VIEAVSLVDIRNVIVGDAEGRHFEIGFEAESLPDGNLISGAFKTQPVVAPSMEPCTVIINSSPCQISAAPSTAALDAHGIKLCITVRYASLICLKRSSEALSPPVASG